jgi:AcrR family transcriptional regulator
MANVSVTSESSSRQDQILAAATRVIARNGVRGLRVEELAKEAGVSTGLIYYYFKDRGGLLSATLEYINARADRYTAETDAEDPRTELEQVLLLEMQDTDEVRENSIAWGELRATATFEEELQEQLLVSTRKWIEDTAEVIRRAQAAGLAAADADAIDAAERLTALVEGLSERWLSGSMTLERARELLRRAVSVELGPAPGR